MVQSHCHEHAVFGCAAARRVLQGWGTGRVVESSSCCGVAGNFGFETDHYDMSMRVAEHSIGAALNRAPTGSVIADGFSCAVQVGQLDPDRGSVHRAVALNSGSNQRLTHRRSP